MHELLSCQPSNPLCGSQSENKARVQSTGAKGEEMKFVKYDVGIWKAEASVEDVGDNKRLATISAVAGEKGQAAESKHTVVFDHVQGNDEIEEVKMIMARVLSASH